MDLTKIKLPFKHICTTKIKSPLQFKSKRRIEGEAFQERNSQEERMTTSSEEALVQKLLKRVEA